MNKALAGCIYNMNSIGDVQAKKAVFDELKKDGFKKLGIEGKNEEYFYNYNKNNYKIFREISMSDFDEFMIKNGSRMEKRQFLQNKYLQVKSDIPKVSIVVPIYNVEDYLEECLESVVRQTLEDIEIICINDGSTDRSMEILKTYAAADARIIVVDKKMRDMVLG